ncbi:hypothetical protein [Sphingomonas oligophenolica]|uniref:Uncharacterized protein n=1 Tax=Sphingomonas oligophenolica TaxID=301154 RepID=A0A502CSR4_9SPHN|nr:hypothetical protein [Sphingomonas oligophenolica]TPG15550.1 hypothetical protein EAH84_01770 [Sphingomonas oligophenolica]
MRRAITIGTMALAIALAGCGSPSDTPAAAPTASEPAKPAFAADGPAVIAAVRSFGSPWNEARTSEPMVDTRTGGTVRVLNGATGSAQIFSRRDGKVWQVKLVTGAPNHCGVSQPLLAALPKLAAVLTPGTTISDADRNTASDGLLTLGRKTHEMSGIAVTTQGGCTHWLTLAVPEVTPTAP